MLKKGKMPAFIHKNYKKMILIAVALVILVVAAFVFKFLVKVGNIKYIYNYMNDTAGSLPALQRLAAAAGADAEEAAPIAATEPNAHGIVEHILMNGEPVSSYQRQEAIYFTDDEIKGFSEMEGILTFRGNYMRNLSAFGTTALSEKKFNSDYWSYATGKVLKSNGVDFWSGNGWTGQPVVVKWDESTKAVMNLYDEVKKKPGLIEVIYPGMDGWIHFLDMETGKETRPSINVGMAFKGSASLYPNGIPMLICGSGDAQTGPFGENVSPRFYIYSLIDGSLLYEHGYNDSFAPRIWHAYDSSPIVHTETDTLIYPGENGVIYTMKLNTVYDSINGSLSINPSELVEYSFTSDQYGYNEAAGERLWGSECSAVVWKNYLYLGDNGGTFYCLDLNTMSMVWAQDLKEDVNSTPMFEIDEDGNKFLYAATTLKYGYNENSIGNAAIFKLNAITGEIIWEKAYETHTVKGLAGGMLSTGVIGEGKIADYVIYSVSKTPGLDGGYLVALDKKTGNEVWRTDLVSYSWSSSVMIYATDGSAVILQGCNNGDLLMVDAETGNILDKLNFGSGIEATPVVFDNKVVFGIRSEKIIGVTLK